MKTKHEQAMETNVGRQVEMEIKKKIKRGRIKQSLK